MTKSRMGGKMFLRNLGYISAAALSAAMAMPAAAQDDAAPAPVAETGEIVVTALKRAQTLNKVSVAVTALGQDQLVQQGIKTITDLTAAVPNVQIHTIGPVGFSGVSIRGVSNRNFTQLGSPAVATYVDGVYAPVSQAVSGGLYDIERIEVLRGPQGTTYGQNATGGNLNIITAGPKNSFDAFASISYGSYNAVEAQGMINLPLGDQLSARAAVMVRRSDGFFETEGTTRRNYAAADEFGGRLSLQWTPSDSFSWRLTGEVYRNHGTPPNMLLQIGTNREPANGRSPYSQPFSGAYPEPDIDLENYAVRTRAEWTLLDGLTLAYVGGYQHQKSSYIFGIVGVNETVYDSEWLDDVDAYSNELNLSFEGGRLQNIFGISQFHKTNPYSQAFHFNAIGLDQYRPGGAAQSTFGIFDQATFTVVDGVRVIGGIRWSRESQNNQGSYVTINCPQTAGTVRTYNQIRSFDAQNLGAGCFTSPVPFAEGSWTSISWKGGAEWDFNPGSMAYLTITNGFKSGQVQPGLPDIFDPFVNPEELINYELGVKAKLLNNRLNIRLAAYYMDYKDIQVTAVTLINNFSYIFTQNAAQAEIYGAELEWQFQLTDDDSFNGFLAYTHATYGDYLNAVDGQTGLPVGVNLKGNFLAGAPEWSLRAEYAHTFDLANGGKLIPSGSFYYQSKSYLREFNYFIDKVDAYTKSSLTLTYEDPTGRWKASAYVHNLEDEAVRNTGNTALGRYFSDYMAPRTWGVRVAYSY